MRLRDGQDLWSVPVIPGLMQELALLARLELIELPGYGRFALSDTGRLCVEAVGQAIDATI